MLFKMNKHHQLITDVLMAQYVASGSPAVWTVCYVMNVLLIDLVS